MPLQLCYICTHNHPNEPRDQVVSYENCEHCSRPTCKKHGRVLNGDRFRCIRCPAEFGTR